jgi:TfoX/Sxy family transcriptional regulator of competence genes
MAYDEDLAARVRAMLSGPDVVEREMFGGLSFMVDGHMCCGVIGNDLVARLGAAGADAALGEPHTRAMDFTGRPMRGFVFVGAQATADQQTLRRSVDAARNFVATLPAKRSGRRKRK